METHHLYHLAACWSGRKTSEPAKPPPLATGPVRPSSDGEPASQPVSIAPLAGPDTFIKVSAAQMVFASRMSQDFITPEQVSTLEHWTGEVRRFIRPIFWCHLKTFVKRLF